jgi:hypothetical protein
MLTVAVEGARPVTQVEAGAVRVVTRLSALLV